MGYMFILYTLYCRHILASLHFNENLQRQTQKRKDGTTYVKVTYPKYKDGNEVVKEISCPPSYSMFSKITCTLVFCALLFCVFNINSSILTHAHLFAFYLLYMFIFFVQYD